MKKPWLFVLLLVTGMLTAFTMGFFVGRNANTHDIIVNVADTSISAETTSVPDPTVETTVSPAMTADGKIDLNLASTEDLIQLPGIGESLAELILNYRNSHGRFTSLDELLNISGIGEKKVEALRDYLTIVP